MESVPFTIIGGGVIGSAIANKLSQSYGENVFVLEKNSSIRAENQSSRNSGVVHAGIYYSKVDRPLKSDLCVKGNALMYPFCEKNSVLSRKTGKLVVATSCQEEEYLEDLLSTAINNGVPGVRLITGKEAQKVEPNIIATSALYVPTSGIVEATSLVGKLNQLAESNGATFLFGSEVVDIISHRNSFQVTVKSNNEKYCFETNVLINAAGLYSDEIARMVNSQSKYEVEGVRGEAAKFYRTKRENVWVSGMNIYPAPYGYFNDNGEKAGVSLDEFKDLEREGIVTKTVGVHLTPTFDFMGGDYVVGDTITIGPAKTVEHGKEDYGSDLRDERYYLGRIKSFFPNLKLRDIQLHQAGIMAVPKGHKDFIIERDPSYNNCINLIGIDSPGLTSSLAIADYINSLI